MGRGRSKRLTVRLRSADRDELARDLGAGLSERGLVLISDTQLDPGTAVHVDLRFADGTPALEGEGVVAGLQAEPPAMHLELEWAPACRPILYWVIAKVAEPSWDVHVEVPSTPECPPVEADTGDLAAALDDLLEGQAPAPAPTVVPPPAVDWGGEVPEFPADELQLAFEAPVEEDGTLSDDLVLEDSSPSLDLSTGDLDDEEPILLEDVVEEPPEPYLAEAMPAQAPPAAAPAPVVEERTRYAFSSGARDELGPGPAPDNALESSDVPPPPPAPQLSEESREDGEVTPLARIELVRRSDSAVPAGALAPPPPDVASRVPPSAIPSKRHRPPIGPPSRRALGVDPGDQTTRIGIVERGSVRVVPSRRGAPGVPSAVFMDPSGKTIVGEPAARRLPWHPDSGMHGTKRLLGRFFCAPRIESLKARLPVSLGAAEEDEVALSIGQHFISIEEIQALIIKEAKASATFALQDEINRVVLTCPGSYGVRQRRALAVSANLAGMHVERVLSSPLAVVLGQLKQGRLGQGRFLVYELGARFFDASVVQVDGHGARVRGAAGDPELGGAEFDRALADLVLEEMKKVRGVMPASRTSLFDVVDAAELGKCNLSSDAITRIAVEHPEADGVPAFSIEVEVTREEAERRTAGLLEHTLTLVREAVASAAMRPEDIDGVLLAGGQTRAPQVRARLEAMFPGRVLDLDPCTAALHGAAWAAYDVDSTAPFGLIERLPASIVHRPRRQPPRTVLPVGVALPATGRFTQVVEDPEDAHLFLFQGDRGDLERDEPLAHLVLDAVAGRFEVQVELTPSGQMSFTAHDEHGTPVGVREVQELSREDLRGHYGQHSMRELTPAHGLYERLLQDLASDERYS